MDNKLQELFDNYRAINNEEKEGDLEEAANAIRERQNELMETEGHMGL